MSFAADDSSSNRESVFLSKARFSMPPLVGVLERKERGMNIMKEAGNCKDQHKGKIVLLYGGIVFTMDVFISITTSDESDKSLYNQIYYVLLK